MSYEYEADDADGWGDDGADNADGWGDDADQNDAADDDPAVMAQNAFYSGESEMGSDPAKALEEFEKCI